MYRITISINTNALILTITINTIDVIAVMTRLLYERDILTKTCQ